MRTLPAFMTALALYLLPVAPTTAMDDRILPVGSYFSFGYGAPYGYNYIRPYGYHNRHRGYGSHFRAPSHGYRDRYRHGYRKHRDRNAYNGRHHHRRGYLGNPGAHRSNPYRGNWLRPYSNH